MNASLTYDTKLDLLRVIDWFDRISRGLGDQFEQEFFAALGRVKSDPELFAPDHTGFRPCPLKRFTAVLYFRIDSEIVVVTGLFTSGENETVLQYRG